MKILSYTSLVRVVDPRYPTNLAILVLSILAGGVQFGFTIAQGSDLLTSLTNAIPIGLTVFLTWAVAREIDPEHELSAFLGLALAIPGYYLFNPPDLLAVFMMLLLIRIINRTTGISSRILDSLVVSGLGLWLTYQGNWIYGFLTAAALLIDSRLPPPRNQNLVFSMVITVFTFLIMIFLLEPITILGTIQTPDFYLVLVMSILIIPLTISTRRIELVCDFSPERVNPLRAQAGQIFTVTSLIIVWLLQGREGIGNLFPIWSSVLALSLSYIFSLFLSRIWNR